MAARPVDVVSCLVRRGSGATTGGLPLTIVASIATPPSSAKIGAPRTPPISTIVSQGHSGWPDDHVAMCVEARTPATMPSAATPRPIHCGEACQTRRSAISANPIGSARSATQVGRPMRDDVARHPVACTSATPPSANSVAMAAPSECRRSRARGADRALRHELAGGERQQLAVTRGDRRAEQAEPQREIRRRSRPIRESTVPKNLRDAISASGSSMMPPRARLGDRVLGARREPPSWAWGMSLPALGLADGVAFLHRHLVDVRRDDAVTTPCSTVSFAASARNSAAAFASSLITSRPRSLIALTDAASRAGTSVRTRVSIASAAAVTFADRQARSCSRRRFVMTSAPVSGAMCTSSMYVASRNVCSRLREIRRIRRRVDQTRAELELRRDVAGVSATGMESVRHEPLPASCRRPCVV